MSVQIFLQGKILGIEDFLLTPSEGSPAGTLAGERLLAGRAHYVTLLSEVLPRALLSELGLAKILLGSSGGGQFLVVLPLEVREQADAFLAAARSQMDEFSGGALRLIWASTENLGDWSVVRKRINEAIQHKRQAPLADMGPEVFLPQSGSAAAGNEEYFTTDLALRLAAAETVGWSPEEPGKVQIGGGKHQWTLNTQVDGIPLARHTAPADDEHEPADAANLARRSGGTTTFGILLGDVDGFGIRLRRVQSIEEHVQLSVMYNQFFAGELEVLCSMPEFWRKVSVLYAGGDEFAVYGAWDALIPLAREIQRLFHRFGEANLKDFPGPEGKTITMALSLAPEVDSPLSGVYEEASRKLSVAKSADKDCFSLLGRTLEWRQLGEAVELTDTLTRMVKEFGCDAQFLLELGGFYRESAAPGGLAVPGVQTMRRGKGSHFEKPWQIHRRLNRVIGVSRDRDFQKLRSNLITELIGKGTQVKLRPAGRVALEWARLATGV